jgi:hypothetical protein
MNRRTMLMSGTAGIAAVFLVGCTSTTVNGVTTVTLNVAKVNAYGQVVVSGVGTLLSIAAVVSLVGAPAVAIIQAGSVALSAALAAWNKASAGQVTVTFDGSSVGTAFTSVMAAVNTVINQTETALAAIPTVGVSATESSAISTAITLLNAMKTGYNFLQAMATVGVAMPLVVAAPAFVPMTEAQMFATVGMKNPL